MLHLALAPHSSLLPPFPSSPFSCLFVRRGPAVDLAPYSCPFYLLPVLSFLALPNPSLYRTDIPFPLLTLLTTVRLGRRGRRHGVQGRHHRKDPLEPDQEKEDHRHRLRHSQGHLHQEGRRSHRQGQG